MTPPDKPVDEQPEEQAEANPKAAAKKPAAAKKAAVDKKPAAEKKPPAKKPAAAKASTAAKSPEKDAEESAQPKSAAPETTAKKAPARNAKAAAKAEEAGDPKAGKPSPSTRSAAARTQGSAPSRRKIVSAHARYVRTSARKARMVCGHLRGKSVEEARAILAFTPREVARDWSKLLESAVANAENNHELIEEDLFVREAFADEGPTIKRFRPRAQGRAAPIRKRTSHLTITLTPKA
jgi:ribosomal protein L22